MADVHSQTTLFAFHLWCTSSLSLDAIPLIMVRRKEHYMKEQLNILG